MGGEYGRSDQLTNIVTSLKHPIMLLKCVPLSGRRFYTINYRAM